jgi:hypothetical protein
MSSRRRNSRGQFITREEGFARDLSAASTTPLPEPESDEFETASENENETVSEMDDRSQAAAAAELSAEIRDPITTQNDIVRIHRFQIDKLTKANVRNWKLLMQDYMELQGCWEVIEYMNREPTRVAEILTKKEWRTQNAKARIHIRDNISMEDITETRHLEGAGEIWKHLMRRYEVKNEAEEIAALERVLIWTKDPSKSIEESLKELERLNTELKEISEGKNGMRDRTLMFIFLKGLTKEFEAVRSGIIGSGGEAFQRDVVLSKL